MRRGRLDDPRRGTEGSRGSRGVDRLRQARRGREGRMGKASLGSTIMLPSTSVLSLKKAEHMARLARLLYREGEHAHRTPEGSAGVDRGRARHAGIADDSGADPAAPGAARADHLAVQRGAGQY